MAKKVISIFLALMLIFGVATVPVSAAGDRSITLVCNVDGVSIEDMNWSIYYVGERDNSSSSTDTLMASEKNNFKLAGAFQDLPVDMTDLSDTRIQEAADTLENYAVLGNYTPDQSKKTNQSGTITFDGLDSGLYLLVGETYTQDGIVYFPSATLIEVGDSDETVDLMSYPKFSVASVLGAKDVTYLVQKVWQNDTDEDHADIDLTINLYKNNKLADTITLNAANDWEYTWSGTDIDSWRVEEVEVPDGYNVVYRSDRRQYVIANTRTEILSGRVTTTSEATETTTETTTTTTPTTAGVTRFSMTTSNEVKDEHASVETTHEIGMARVSKTETTEEAAAVVEETTTTTTADGKVNVIGAASGGSSGDSPNTGEKLPQTGLVWWPVPILLCVGVICLCVSFRLRRKRMTHEA